MATKFLAAAVVAFTAVVLVPGAMAGDLTVVGAATPASLAPGSSTLLTVAVTPLSGQPGGDLGVVCNLAPIGGAMTLLHDDGTNGDATPGDLTFSDLVVIPGATAPGTTLDFFCVANDSAGGAAGVDIFVTVTPKTPVNEPPTLDAGGPYTVEVGSSVTLVATGSDPEGGPLTYAWDLNDDGTFETPGQTVTVSADDALSLPVPATVEVQVTDDSGLTAVADTTVTVIVTFDGVCNLVHAYSTDPKFTDNLCGKLDDAANAPTPTAKAGALEAFRNMVGAKVGKALTAEQATELKLLSTRL